MALNYPGPFEVRINYVTDENVAISSHQLRLSCNMDTEGAPGSPFSDWFPISRDDGVSNDLEFRVGELVGVLQPLLADETDFVSAELWEYAPGTFDAVFRSALSLSVSGSSAVGTVSMSQTIFTFRSALGGIMKVDVRGTVFVVGPRVALPTTGVAQDLVDYLLGDTNIWIARDGGFPIVGLYALVGQNERAFKKLNR